MAKHAKHKRTAAEDERILKVDVLPYWRDRSVRELTRRDVRALVDRVADRAPIMANRVLAVVRKMLNFAVDHDWIDANPAARVQKPASEVSRDRVLTDDEIRRLWRILSNVPTTEQKPAPGRKRAKGEQDDPLCPISPALAAALKVRLLTAQRGGEVARMRWSNIVLPPDDPKVPQVGWWTIPGEHTKNGEPHRVPLTADVVALIREQRRDDREQGEYVFTAMGIGSVTLDVAKASGILVVTKELVKLSRPSSEPILRDELAAGSAQFLDTQFVDPSVAPVANVSPGSILNGTTPIASAGGTAANALTDVKALISAFTAANPDVEFAVLLMSPANAVGIAVATGLPGLGLNGGVLFGVPVVTSTALGSNIAMLDARGILFADDGDINISLSRSATVEMNTTPADPTAASTVMVSLFQRGLVGLRVDRLINWKRGRLSAVKYVSGATYV